MLVLQNLVEDVVVEMLILSSMILFYMISVIKWSQNRNYKRRENVYTIVYSIYFTDQYLAAKDILREDGERERI